MQSSFVITVVGPDRPGLVESISEVVVGHGGSWVESRMASVAGQFAGLVWVRVGAEKAGALQKDLESLEKRDLKVVVRSAGSATPRPARVLKLELLGHDRPGIVRELAKALARRNVNVEELTSETYSAPMSGDSLFKATLELGVPAEIDVEALRRDLKSVGDQLDLDVLTLEAGK